MNESENTYLKPIELSHELLTDLLERIKENDKGEPFTWGATPLSISSDTLMQQLAVKRYMSSLFNSKHTPRYIPDAAAIYIEGLNMARTAQRESRNTDSYIYRGVMIADGMPIDVLGVIEGALRGSASPAELLFVAQILKIPTIELASLTHPYGQRIDQLKKMRPAINEAIELMGGVQIDGRKSRRFEVKGSDNHVDTDHMTTLEMTRKTDFGLLPDNTEVLERSSFGLLVNKLPKYISKEIKAIPYGKYWSHDVASIDGFEDVIDELLDKDRYEIAPPISTTVVARNPELEEALLSKEAIRGRQKQYMASHALHESLI